MEGSGGSRGDLSAAPKLRKRARCASAQACVSGLGEWLDVVAGLLETLWPPAGSGRLRTKADSLVPMAWSCSMAAHSARSEGVRPGLGAGTSLPVSTVVAVLPGVVTARSPPGTEGAGRGDTVGSDDSSLGSEAFEQLKATAVAPMISATFSRWSFI